MKNINKALVACMVISMAGVGLIGSGVSVFCRW